MLLPCLLIKSLFFYMVMIIMVKGEDLKKIMMMIMAMTMLITMKIVSMVIKMKNRRYWWWWCSSAYWSNHLFFTWWWSMGGGGGDLTRMKYLQQTLSIKLAQAISKTAPRRNSKFIFLSHFGTLWPTFESMVGAGFDPLWANNETFY